jgi:hypothetical protein
MAYHKSHTDLIKKQESMEGILIVDALLNYSGNAGK